MLKYDFTMSRTEKGKIIRFDLAAQTRGYKHALMSADSRLPASLLPDLEARGAFTMESIVAGLLRQPWLSEEYRNAEVRIKWQKQDQRYMDYLWRFPYFYENTMREQGKEFYLHPWGVQLVQTYSHRKITHAIRYQEEEGLPSVSILEHWNDTGIADVHTIYRGLEYTGVILHNVAFKGIKEQFDDMYHLRRNSCAWLILGAHMGPCIRRLNGDFS